MKYIDIHTHHPPLSDDDVISIVDISSSSGLSMSISTPYCSYGIHPWFLTEKNVDNQLKQLELLLQNNVIIAIGEVGFDTTHGAGMELQQRIFEEVVSLSEYYRKPLIIHCVKACDKLLLLHKSRKPKQTWLVHGFHDGNELALQLIKHNILCSFGTKLLKDDKLQSVFSFLPIDCIFLETDNTTVNIADIYQTAAKIRNMETGTLKHILFENFMRIFLL